MSQLSGEWLSKPATRKVCAALENAGKQVLFVGGCVRNTLLGAPVSDIDLSTDALPQEVIKLSEAAGLRALPTGIEHGTITVISDHIPHEITTFRKDVETDGRRAVVAFSPDVEDDAQRRDFTMNAIYATASGEVIDPLNGMADLQRRFVRFIADPDMRIREDYLRILRFFRFHAWYGNAQNGMDPDALSAIASNLDGLTSLSKERVGAEIKKLLAAPDPAPAVAAMRSTGVLNVVLPGADDKALAPLVHFEQAVEAAPNAIRRLAALGAGWSGPLRLSKSETREIAVLRSQIGAMSSMDELGFRLGQDVARDVLLLRSAVFGTPPAPSQWSEIKFAAAQVFPVKAVDLMPEVQGKALGEKLNALQSQWIASGFRLSKKQLLG